MRCCPNSGRTKALDNKTQYDAGLEPIVGSGVLLRPITADDTPLIVRWRNTEAVRQNFIFREPFTAEMHTNWLNTKVATGAVVQYMILDRETGERVGSVYFRDIDRRNRSAEYGVFIGEESARGKGLGSETARIFTDFGFNVLGLYRISLRLLSENTQAEKSYLNAGFKREGVFHDMVFLDGKYRDITFMAKLNGGEKND